jgi:hypothetical protein
MLRRTLILTLTLAAALAVIGVGGASAKPSFSFGFVLPPIPQLTFTTDPIDMWCKGKLESDGHVQIHCNNTGKLVPGGPTNSSNPNPPKDAKILRLPQALKDVKLPGFLSALTKITLYYEVWPSGAVTADISLKGL